MAGQPRGGHEYADGDADATLYDPAGRMVAKTDTLGRTTKYGYDGVSELTQVTDALGDYAELNTALKGIGEVGFIDTSVSSFAAVGAGFL